MLLIKHISSYILSLHLVIFSFNISFINFWCKNNTKKYNLSINFASIYKTRTKLQIYTKIINKFVRQANIYWNIGIRKYKGKEIKSVETFSYQKIKIIKAFDSFPMQDFRNIFLFL